MWVEKGRKIDSAHGNFNRIASKEWAAVNRYLTSWTIFSGLPLAAIASRRKYISSKRYGIS